jgi:uncharacterized protein
MPSQNPRRPITFASNDSFCSAWHYPGTNGACVIMAAGLAVTKEPGTDRLATRLHEAGYSVLAFDYRRLGESGGTPRQLVKLRDQLADYDAAVDHAATLPEVDADKLAIWGFSVSGGHVFAVAARNEKVAAAIAHAPLADGLHAMANALQHITATALIRLFARAVLDAIGGAFGSDPLLVPLAGERGAVAALTTPDSRNYVQALNPENRYPGWHQAVAARSAVRVGFYRPGRYANRVAGPLLVLTYDNDGVAPPAPAMRAARSAARGELACIPGGHYAAFLDAEEETVQAILSFLDRHLHQDRRDIDQVLGHHGIRST